MIADKKLGNIYEVQQTKEMIPVSFEWFEAEKKRIAKIADDGTEIGVCIGDVIDGDILCETKEKVYVVVIKPSKLVSIKVKSMTEMGKLCFELGNRHLSLKIMENQVLVPFDHPTYHYLEKLGFTVSVVEEKFADFIQCKAHGVSGHNNDHSHEHTHSHDHFHGEHSHG